MKQQSRPIVIISLITAACLVGDSMLYVVLPIHWQEMGLDSLWQIGVILATNRIARLPFNPLVSYLYRKLSARNGILIAIFLSIFTTASYGFVSNFLIFILLRCIWGLAWTFFRLGAYFTIIDYSTDNTRGKYMGMYNGLYRLGSLFGMLFGGICADLFGVMITALAFAMCSLLCIPFVFIYIKKSTKGMVAEHVNKENDFSLWQHKNILSILAVGMFIAMIFQGMIMSTMSYLIEIHNSSTVALGTILIGAASLSGIIQAIRWSWEPWLAPFFGSLSDRKNGAYRVLVISTGIATILFAVVSFSLPIYLWLIILLLLQMTGTSLTTIADVLAAKVAVNSAKIKIMTMYSMLLDLGAALGPVIAYLMNQYLDPYASYWAAAVLFFLITIKYAKRAFRA